MASCVLTNFFSQFQSEANRTKKKNREDLGIELYGVQQELARNQMMLEQNHDEFSAMKQLYTSAQNNLTETRDMYRNLQSVSAAERKKGLSKYLKLIEIEKPLFSLVLLNLCYVT